MSPLAGSIIMDDLRTQPHSSASSLDYSNVQKYTFSLLNAINDNASGKSKDV